MSFLASIDGHSILERNASRVEGLELRSAQKLLKQYKAAKDELKVRMLAAPDNSFTEAKLRSALDEINKTISMLKRKVSGEAQQQFLFMHEQGVEDSGYEVNKFEKQFAGVSTPLPIDAIITSTEPENLLFNQYQSSINNYDDGLRNGFQNALTQSLLQKKTWSQAVWDMESVFDASEYVLARIVRTELHGIYGQSKNKGFLTIRDNYLPDLQKTLYHPMDARTGDDSEYLMRNPLITDLDVPFHYVWKGKERTFMTPPDRPHDRAILIPYRSEWN